MNPCKMSARRAPFLLASLLAGAGVLGAADDANTTKTAAPSGVTASATQPQNDEIARLKAALAEQQKQLQAMQEVLRNQQQLIEKAVGIPAVSQHPSLGEVASLSPMIPSPAPLPVSI